MCIGKIVLPKMCVHYAILMRVINIFQTHREIILQINRPIECEKPRQNTLHSEKQKKN